ncbi:MAG: peptidoglycan DD-metalloendopeptidase family protein [Bacteroidota bacterium]|nr:peptidoglycan DD-metalloendopeptidase family protein [Bacteroidota bacterium]
MKKCNVTVRQLLVLCFFFSIGIMIGQTSKSDLESQRKALEKQIKSTTETLQKTEKSKSKSVTQLNALNTQIKQRQDLLATINKELQHVSQEAAEQEKSKKEADTAIGDLESRLQHALRTAYVRSQLQPEWIYLLSANSFSQALIRWMYLRQYKRYVSLQLNALSEKKEAHQQLFQQLEENKKEKLLLYNKEEQNKKEILVAKQKQETLVKDLGKEEKKLRSQLTTTQAKKKKLDDEIARLIKVETKKVSTAGLTSAPETKALNDQFSSNKGKLPWPVSKGSISGRFGEHPHPILKGIVVQNNGIDIEAEAGANVKSLFNGTVASVTRIPGYDYMIMVRHGLYFTVYSKLVSVSVKKGDNITTGQLIGKLGSEEPELHLEIWKDKTKMNPESWIAKR